MAGGLTFGMIIKLKIQKDDVMEDAGWGFASIDAPSPRG